MQVTKQEKKISSIFCTPTSLCTLCQRKLLCDSTTSVCHGTCSANQHPSTQPFAVAPFTNSLSDAPETSFISGPSTQCGGRNNDLNCITGRRNNLFPAAQWLKGTQPAILPFCHFQRERLLCQIGSRGRIQKDLAVTEGYSLDVLPEYQSYVDATLCC